MRSRSPKVLHPVAGRPLLHYPLRAALASGADEVIVVVSPGTEAAVRAHVATLGDAALRVALAVQEVPRGTGDAARVGLAAARATPGRVLLLCGDTPLVEAADLAPLFAAVAARPGLALLSALPADPTGYGRVVRGPTGEVEAVREHRDLDDAARAALLEVNAGVYVAEASLLREGLAALRPDNAQGELYLTDVVAFAARAGAASAVVGPAHVLVGVNDRAQLEEASQLLHARIAGRLRAAGVTVRGDARVDDGVTVEEDAVLEAGVHLRGATRVGAGAHIDVGSVLTDAVIAAGARIKPYSVLDSCEVGTGAEIGPFARLRPGTVVEEAAHVGNFVEAKNTRLGRGAKANHLAYLGDGDVGAGANIGAGTIFCNYDGFAKHRTEIGEGAFIGSDSQLVAPVRVGKGAYVATGTTVTRDVPDDALAIARPKQENKEGYGARLRGRLAAQAKRR